LTDEQVVLLADIASTGFSGAESGQIKIGDVVVVFAQGPIGLCATAGAKLMGAALIIGVDGDDNRLQMSKRMGADIVLDYRECDVVAEVKKLTGDGADVAIEALGTQQTFESALRCLRPAGTLSSLGVYSGKLQIPYDAFAAGIGDHRILTTLCPGGKERMRRLMEVVRTGRVDLTPLLTHRFSLDQIKEGYKLFGERADGVLKVVITP
jgi:threonine dehydrogenase-like Zn-dependent dehydrogenase